MAGATPNHDRLMDTCRPSLGYKQRSIKDKSAQSSKCCCQSARRTTSICKYTRSPTFIGRPNIQGSWAPFPMLPANSPEVRGCVQKGQQHWIIWQVGDRRKEPRWFILLLLRNAKLQRQELRVPASVNPYPRIVHLRRICEGPHEKRVISKITFNGSYR